MKFKIIIHFANVDFTLFTVDLIVVLFRTVIFFIPFLVAPFSRWLLFSYSVCIYSLILPNHTVLSSWNSFWFLFGIFLQKSLFFPVFSSLTVVPSPVGAIQTQNARVLCYFFCSWISKKKSNQQQQINTVHALRILIGSKSK